MNLNTVIPAFTRKARRFGFFAGMLLVLAVHLPSAAFAQDGIDRVTGFARDPVHVAAWPGGKKVAVSFALFVE
jgi:allantoinase